MSHNATQITSVRERSGHDQVPRRWKASLLAVIAVLASLLVVSGPPASATPEVPGPVCSEASWVATWAFPMSQPSTGFQGTEGTSYTDTTFRVVATPSLGGSAVRVRLSNALGDAPLTLASVRVGPSTGGSAVDAGQSRPVTFDGASTVTIPVGQTVTSDPVALTTGDFQPLAVSYFAPGTTGDASEHLLFPESPSPSTPGSMPRMYRATGNRTDDPGGSNFDGGVAGATFLAGIDVFTVNDGAIVAFGDSITEGFNLESVLAAKSSPWAATLAVRLRDLALAGGPRFAVVNAAINGNRLLGEGVGPSFVQRFERDVLQQTGAVGVLMLGGINDLSPMVTQTLALPRLSDLTDAYQDLLDRAGSAGLQMWISPLTPAGNPLLPSLFGHSSTPEQVQRRLEVNQWIRARSGAFDAGFDLNRVIAGLLVPTVMQLRYNSGDSIHPNSAGHAAMGASIDLRMLDAARRCG